MALTRSQIARTLSDEIGLSRKNSAEVITVFIEAITKALAVGQAVQVRNFGRFRVVPGRGRPKESSSSDEPRPHKARRIVRFKCSRILQACLQDGTDSCEETSNLNAAIEYFHKNLDVSDQVQKVLDDHCRWVESEGRKGKKANLSKFDLKGADLFGSNLKSANLSKGRFPSADLSDCDLENASLENADLKGASLAWTNLRHANLRGACLRDTDLRWADLRWADLSEADLSGANLSGADINDATLNEADLPGARVKNTVLAKKSPFSPAGLKLRLRKKLKF